MTANGPSIDFWQQHRLQPGQHREWQAGMLRLWARRTPGHEWRVASEREFDERQDLSCGQNETPPEQASWKRWAFKEEDEMVQVLPIMPDKPVVVRPDSPIHIPKGNEVTFFVSIPVFLQVYVGPERNILIHEDPTVVLSKTWFGEPVGGELCYALRTGASRDLAGIKRGLHRAVCPVVVRNRSEEELNFQKLCVRSMHVNIHRGNRRLWTEEIEVSYLGKNNFSEITFSKQPPAHEPTHGILGPAREPLARNFIRKSFDSLLAF